MIKQIKAEASRILHSSDIETKIESGLKMGAIINGLKISDGSESFQEAIPEYPARPQSYVLMNQTDSTIFDKVEDEAIKVLLESTFINVEISAMEVSSVLLLMANNLEEDFYRDFASHIFDEAQHAIKIRESLNAFGGLPSNLSYNFKLWDKVKSVSLIEEKIMVENVIEEGWAADKSVDLIKSLRKKNYPDIALMFEQINSDEIRHAKIGNKWVMKFLQGDETSYLAMYDQLAQKLHPAATIIHYPPVRIASGFKGGFFKKYLPK